MISNWELWACANSYVGLYHEDASVLAAMRCEGQPEHSDVAVVRTFQAIIERIPKRLEKSYGEWSGTDSPQRKRGAR